MAAIDELLRLVPAPATPIDSSGDWQEAEQTLGIDFPADYKDFIHHYGRGALCNFHIESPFGVRSLWTHWRNMAGYYEDWAGNSRTVPYPVWPVAPGLLPVGYYGDVNAISWYAYGPPESWPIMYCSQEDAFYRMRGLGLIAFLLAALSGTAPLPDGMQEEVLSRPFEFLPGG